MKKMNDSVIKVPGCSASEQRKVDELVQKASELGVEITSENCGNLSDVNNVIRIITLMIWCEFRKKFAQYAERYELNFNRDELQANFEALRHGHYKCSYKHHDFDLSRFVEEISEVNEEHVFREVTSLFGLEQK